MADRYWPLPKHQIRITSRFAGRINPVTGRPENHSGTDFAAPDGTPFYAPQSGTVKYIGPASGYGQWIVVDSSDAEGSGCYEVGHMWNAYATGLKVGSKVKAGQLLGYIGSNGQSTGPHLHLTVWEYAYGGKRIDPETWLKNAKYPGQPTPTPKPTPTTSTNVLDWSARFHFGKPRPTHQIRNIIIHVTVNAPGTPAENVANYQIRSQSGSYHELTDTTVKHLIENTDDWFVWASGNYGNDIGLHRSFVMRGTETRAQWLQYDKMLREAAKRDAEWCRKYNIPPVKLSAADLKAGKRGFAGHLETGQAWGGTDHVDPGTGFPWDVYLGYVRDHLNGTPQEKEGDVLTTKFFTDFLKGFIGPLISDVKDVRQQITGGRDAGEYPGWSISQLVKNYQAKPGDTGTLPEMLAVALTELQHLREDVNKLKEGR